MIALRSIGYFLIGFSLACAVFVLGLQLCAWLGLMPSSLSFHSSGQLSPIVGYLFVIVIVASGVGELLIYLFRPDTLIPSGSDEYTFAIVTGAGIAGIAIVVMFALALI